MSRAKPMTPDERREAIVRATLPLLLDQGPEISTSQIAAAAEVAEGTIFRVFETKAELIHATIHAAVEPTTTLAELAALDPDQPLETRVGLILASISAEITRTRTLFAHLAGAGFGPPRGHPGPDHGRHGISDGRQRVLQATESALAPYADQLRVPVPTAAQLINALAFAATFSATSDNPPPPPELMANTVLYGIAEGEK